MMLMLRVPASCIDVLVHRLFVEIATQPAPNQDTAMDVDTPTTANTTTPLPQQPIPLEPPISPPLLPAEQPPQQQSPQSPPLLLQLQMSSPPPSRTQPRAAVISQANASTILESEEPRPLKGREQARPPTPEQEDDNVIIIVPNDDDTYV